MYKKCRLCGKKSSMVFVVLPQEDGASKLIPGYCINCQPWMIIFSIMTIAGIVCITASLITLAIDIYKFPVLFFGGILLISLGIFVPDLIGLLSGRHN